MGACGRSAGDSAPTATAASRSSVISVLHLSLAASREWACRLRLPPRPRGDVSRELSGPTPPPYDHDLKMLLQAVHMIPHVLHQVLRVSGIRTVVPLEEDQLRLGRRRGGSRSGHHKHS